MANMTLTINAT